MERTSRLLYGAAAALLLVGLLLRIVPAPVGAIQPQSGPSGDSATGGQKAAAQVPAADTVVIGGNIFSATRSAPRVRYTPPDLAPARVALRARPARTSPRLRLMGTVSGAAALIDANPAVPGAELYQIGDVVDGKRIAAVSESTVVLEGASGRTVLRLQPSQQPTR